jgi:hypothetical protein
MRGLIKHILKEETNKFELVKNLIYTMFNNVRFVEYVAERNEVMIYYTNRDNRQMLIPTEICDMITKYTGLNVVPWYEYVTKKYGTKNNNDEPDFYIDTEEYDESLNESIKQHPREEEFNRYKDDIDRIVYSVVSKEEICGYGTEFFLNGGEDALSITLYYNKGYYPGYDKHMENAIDIKFMLENYLPIVEMAFVNFDSTKCKGRVTENKETPKEIEKNLNVIRTILKQVSWDGLCDIWVEYNKMDRDYEIRSKYVSEDFNIDAINKELDFLDNTIRSLGLSAYIYTPWFVDSCEDDVKFINESKEKSTKELITTVLNTLVLPQYEHVICGFELKNVDNESLNNVINYPGVTVTFIGGKGTKLYPQTSGVQKMYDDVLDEIWDTVWDYTGISLELYSKYVKDCGKENIYLRESKETEPKYLSLIEELVEPFKDEEGVCDINVSYDDEVNIYTAYLVIGTEEMNEKFIYVPAMQSHISKLRMNVKNTIKQYIPIDNLYVGSYGKPNCEWDPISK